MAEKRDPYAALRFPEFRLFLMMRFALVFAWSMQFVVIEWQVYSLTKDPLSLGIIGLMEVIPAVGLALLAGHISDQREKRKLLLQCILAFMALSFGLFALTWPELTDTMAPAHVTYGIYALVFCGGVVRAFIGPAVFSLFALVIPRKVYHNAAGWSSSVWQIAAVAGPAVGGLCILWMGVHWSMLVIVGFAMLAFLILLRIAPKPILNTKVGEPIMDSLREGVRFVFRTKVILGALTLDMVAVLFGGAVALLPIYAQDILHVGPTGFGILRAAPAVGSFLIMLGVAYFGSAQQNQFDTFLLDAIAAVVVGGTSLFGGRGGIGNTIIGLLVLGVVNNGLDHIQIDSFLKILIRGLILLAALIINVYAQVLKEKQADLD
jgi:MFS family permease